MRVIAKSKIVAFFTRHKDAEQPLLAWYDEAAKATWPTPQDVKNRYASASVIGNNRIVFNIKGNDYRLIVSMAYKHGAVYIKFIGTHKEYDAVDAATVEQ